MEDTNSSSPMGNGSASLFQFSGTTKQTKTETETETESNITLCTVLNSLINAIVFSQPDAQYGSSPLFSRAKASLSENLPLLKEASTNSAHDVVQWTRQGSALRAILVVSVGTIASLVLTGLLVFTLFFVAATFNAIVISLLVSLAAAGGCLAIFFACVTAIYIGALSIAAFVISIATISAIVATIITTGWIGFFWTVYLATRGGIQLAKRSLNMTGSVLSAYSGTRQNNESTTKSD